LEACPSTINTFLGDAKKAIGITRNELIASRQWTKGHEGIYILKCP